MYYKTDDLNYDEKKFSNKINEILRWAKDSGRNDIVEKAQSFGTINKLTNLKKAYYELNSMKGKKNTSFSSFDSASTTPSMENNEPTAGAANATEPETKAPVSQTAPNPEAFDPLLQAAPKQRDYTSGLNSAAPASAGPIPEPNYAAGAGSFGPKPGEPDNRFGNTQDMPPNLKGKSSRDLAKILVDTYADKVPALFAWITKVPEEKLREMALSGRIDFELMLELPGQKLTVQDYFGNINTSADAAFVVTEEWKEEILPHVIKVLETRNWGVTSEQIIMYMVIMDLAQKTMIALSMKRDINRLINQLEVTTTQLRQTGHLPEEPRSSGPEQAGPPPSPTPPPPPAPPVPPVGPNEPILVEAEEVPYEPAMTVASRADMDDIEQFPAHRQAGGRPSNFPPPEEAEVIPVVNQTLNEQ